MTTESQSDITRASVRDLLQLDRLHRKASTIQQFLKDCNIREKCWNDAIKALQIWVDIQQSVSEYILFDDKKALKRVHIELEDLLTSIGELLFFSVSKQQLDMTGACYVTQINFDKMSYRYQGFDKLITCIIPLSTQPSPNDFDSILSRINEMDRRADIVLVLLLGNAENVRDLHSCYSSEYNIVLIDEFNLKTLLFSEDIRMSFKRMLVRDLDLRVIQPYSHTGIRSSMFYGRDTEISKILNNQKSYAIFGPRRIGKTFLVQQVKSRLEIEPENKVFYLSCEKQGANQLRLRLLRALNLEIPEKLEDSFEEDLRVYIERSGEKFVFVLDEVDALIAEDANTGSRFFVSLRNLHNEFRDQCWFIFVGFQTLAWQFDHQLSPFFNFSELLSLGCLSNDAARRLVSDPMEKDLFLTFDERDHLIEYLLEKTMKHPALIQFMCAKLVGLLCEDDRKTITRDDIDTIFEDYEYRSLISKSFWNVLEKIQQLFALQMLQMPDTITSLQLRDELAISGIDLSIGDVERNLDGMISAGIIGKRGRFYSFTDKLFSDLLSHSEDTISLFDRLRREVDAQFARD